MYIDNLHRLACAHKLNSPCAQISTFVLCFLTCLVIRRDGKIPRRHPGEEGGGGGGLKGCDEFSFKVAYSSNRQSGKKYFITDSLK